MHSEPHGGQVTRSTGTARPRRRIGLCISARRPGRATAWVARRWAGLRASPAWHAGLAAVRRARRSPAVGELIIDAAAGAAGQLRQGHPGHGRQADPAGADRRSGSWCSAAWPAGSSCRRRYAGAAVFALVAVLGLIGVGARPGGHVGAYVPTVVGLLLGYMILSTLDHPAAPLATAPRHRRRRSRAPRPGGASWPGPSWSAPPATVAAVGGRCLAGAASGGAATRGSRLRLPAPAEARATGPRRGRPRDRRT